MKTFNLLLAGVVGVAALGLSTVTFADEEHPVNQVVTGTHETVKEAGQGTMDAVNHVGKTANDAVNGTSDAVKSLGQGTKDTMNSMGDIATDTQE